MCLRESIMFLQHKHVDKLSLILWSHEEVKESQEKHNSEDGLPIIALWYPKESSNPRLVSFLGSSFSQNPDT